MNDHEWTAEVDGPTPEYYRELREIQGAAWPRPGAMTRAEHAALTAALRAAEDTRAAILQTLAEHGGPRDCQVCGGPRTCPDLQSTLPYRKCGYAETAPGGAWVHQ